MENSLDLHTLAVYKNGNIKYYNQRNLKPVFLALEDNNFDLSNAYIADRRVSKASAILFAYGKTILCDNFKYGIWYSGIGSILVVMVLFWIAGYNNTAYYPSLLDAASSLTINNSSSSYFTLSVMSWVTVIIPFVIAYIVYAWRCLNKEPITSDEMKSDDHKY